MHTHVYRNIGAGFGKTVLNMSEEERYAFFAHCHVMGTKDVMMRYGRDVTAYE